MLANGCWISQLTVSVNWDAFAFYKYYSKFCWLFVTPPAPLTDKSVRCAFFFYFRELTLTKITYLIYSTTAVDKNLDSQN